MVLPASFYQSHLLHFCLAGVFFLSGLITNLVQGINSIFVWRINRQLYRRINCYLNYTVWSQVLFLAEWWSGCDLKIYADPSVIKSLGTEHGLIIMNHTYEVDWLMGWIVGDRCKVLGNCKVFVKKVIQYVPVIGWGWYFAEMVFLQRKWDEDKIVIREQLSQLAQYQDPMWLLLFCEGTRFTPEKHAQSMEVARNKGLRELKHHLLPRTRGFVFSVQQLRGSVPAVYDVTVGFNRQEGAAPTLMNMLNGRTIQAEMCIRRFNLDEIPEDEEGCVQWLQNLYQEKDRILDSYIRTGSFSQESGFPSWPVTKPPRRWCSLINMVGWTVVIVTPLIYYLFKMLTSGSCLVVGSALLIIAAGIFGLNKMIGLTSVEKSSSYGSASNGSPSSPKKIH